jgi:hypothetical protein
MGKPSQYQGRFVGTPQGLSAMDHRTVPSNTMNRRDDTAHCRAGIGRSPLAGDGEPRAAATVARKRAPTRLVGYEPQRDQ